MGLNHEVYVSHRNYYEFVWIFYFILLSIIYCHYLINYLTYFRNLAQFMHVRAVIKTTICHSSFNSSSSTIFKHVVYFHVVFCFVVPRTWRRETHTPAIASGQMPTKYLAGKGLVILHWVSHPLKIDDCFLPLSHLDG